MRTYICSGLTGLRKRLYECENVFLVVTLFALSGCVTNTHTLSATPAPPQQGQYYSIETHTALPPSAQAITAHDAAVLPETAMMAVPASVPVDGLRGAKPLNCNVNDRFDSKAVIAYEWNRSRLSLDVDGVMGGDDGFRVEYKIRFQPEKNKKELCRFQSRWQGIVGSGYNELFLRDSDTVYEEFRDIRDEIKTYIDRSF